MAVVLDGAFDASGPLLHLVVLGRVPQAVHLVQHPLYSAGEHYYADGAAAAV